MVSGSLHHGSHEVAVASSAVCVRPGTFLDPQSQPSALASKCRIWNRPHPVRRRPGPPIRRRGKMPMSLEKRKSIRFLTSPADLRL